MPRLFLVLLLLFTARAAADKQEPRILFLGDSITYGGNWTVHVESAIRAQKGMARATIVNMGLSSETTSGLSEPGHAGGAFPRPDLHERLGRVLEQFKPTLVVACYGSTTASTCRWTPRASSPSRKASSSCVSPASAPARRS
jgi:hypothetical protein